MLNVIPRPAYAEEKFGEFVINSDTTVYADDQLAYARDALLNCVEKACGYRMQVVVSRKAKIQFLYDRHVAREGYDLEATTDSLVVRASAIAGAFYAVQTIRQLTMADLIDNPTVLTMHAVVIKDEPAYAYRGLMFDEARYFHGADTVKTILDMMAYHKLNVFHWHLSDNEGWRVEIKKYPKLTEVGAYRKGSQYLAWGNKSIDKTPHEGYYTQHELKEIVAYAARRNIMIVPEIDMPAHLGAAIAAYPELSCRNVLTDVPIIHGGTPENNGIGEIIGCAGKEFTYNFIYDVIDELAAIFPAPYFHIGGDEAPKGEWKKCPHCQETMRKYGLENEEQLQGYMNNKIAVYLKRKGKRLIGWNEILTSKKLDNSVIAQYWTYRRDVRVENYLMSGRDVIVSKHQAFYFDMPYAQNGLKTTYEFNLAKYNLNEYPAGILGVEGTLWTEWMPTEERVEYQLFPRMEALAEVAWTPESERNYKDFMARLKKFMPILEKARLEYCPLSMVNVRNPFKRLKIINTFQRKNAHVEYNRAMVIKKRRRYRV